MQLRSGLTRPLPIELPLSPQETEAAGGSTEASKRQAIVDKYRVCEL